MIKKLANTKHMLLNTHSDSHPFEFFITAEYEYNPLCGVFITTGHRKQSG